MPQGKQGVKSVFRVEMVVGPVAMEAAARVPERIQKIETALVNLVRQAAIHRRQGMQHGGGREQVGHRSAGHSEEAALRMRLREQPVAHTLVHGKTKMADKRDRAGGGIRRADARAGDIAPRAVGRFKALETLDQFERMRRRSAKVFVSTERDESAVSRAVREFRVAFVAAVGFAERLDALKQRLVEAARHPLLADHGPAPCQGGKMDEIERRAVAVRAKECLDFVARYFGVHRLQSSKCEDGVVKVRTPISVESRALGRKLLAEEFAHEFRGIAEQPRREPGDLEELEAETHVVWPTEISAVIGRRRSQLRLTLGRAPRLEHRSSAPAPCTSL
ncbi:MAG: hypothetical protein JWR19_794 [Pedosphaera sp.]|nr:hypothetical protein [Pedosphaera sp.]